MLQYTKTSWVSFSLNGLPSLCLVFLWSVGSNFGFPPKLTLRNGANVRRNQIQLLEVAGHRLGVPDCFLCLATVLLWGPSQPIKLVFIGMPSPPVNHPMHDGYFNVWSSAKVTVKQRYIIWPGKIKNPICMPAASCVCRWYLLCSCKMQSHKTQQY